MHHVTESRTGRPRAVTRQKREREMGKGARRGSWVSLTSLACLLALTTSQPPPGKRLARVAERKAGPVVAAYVPDYRMAGIDWPGIAKHLTDIILFSVEISPAGDVIGLDRVQQGLGAAVAEKASNRDLRVLLCIGGAGRSEGFIFVSKKSAERKSFVQRLVMLCNERGLDGIDFDWEGVNFLQDRALLTAYTQLLIQTRKQFKKHGLIVSLAMHPGQEKYMIDQKLANAVDRIHFMAYDNCHRTPCQHSTLDESMGHVVSIKQAMLRYKSSPTKIVRRLPVECKLHAINILHTHTHTHTHTCPGAVMKCVRANPVQPRAYARAHLRTC
eukprot:Tamp_15881.p1 GENE.Tamp_15881~~Tamp_15881.p1  ORF type:complete len:329 (-),score=46.50 Tamp_15881:198-1184(-)